MGAVRPKPPFVRFEEVNVTPERKTRVWDVVSTWTGRRLGRVSWFSGWRRYNLFPDVGTTLDALCLREVATFLESAMQARRMR